LVLVVSVARAEEGAAPQNAPPSSAAEAAAGGHVLPSTLAPRIFRGHAFGVARAGYDGAARGFVARAAAESSPFDWLALRVELEHGEVSDARADPDDRARIGARVGLLQQRGAGLDAGLALFYDPRDFRSEGNIIFGLSAGRDWGRLGVTANALVGSDPEGDDQNLELRLAPVYRASRALSLGVDSRARRNLSSDSKRQGTQALDWELEALPTLSIASGSFVFVLDAGVRAVRSTGPVAQPNERSRVDVGVLTMAGAGGAF
jgi:hypothetical protein